MSSLPESLRSTAIAEGIEKFLAGAIVHRCSAVLVVTRSPNDEFLPGIEEVPPWESRRMSPWRQR